MCNENQERLTGVPNLPFEACNLGWEDKGSERNKNEAHHGNEEDAVRESRAN